MTSNTYIDRGDAKPIDRIEFSILGNEEILEMSVIGKDSLGIDIAELYGDGEPKRDGLIDPRLGTTDRHTNCTTCGLDQKACPGHFGHIILSDPVYHMGFIYKLKDVLSMVCIRCSKLLINKKNERDMARISKHSSNKKRFLEIKNLTKNVKECRRDNYGCGYPVPKIKIDIKKSTTSINIVAERLITNAKTTSGFDGKKKLRRILTSDDCWNILKNISDTDCKMMGLDPKKARPENMIIKIFPVPPVPMRPSVKVDFMTSGTREDDLTHKLADIVKVNIRMRRQKESINSSVNKYRLDNKFLLQYQTYTYYDNSSEKMPRSAQRGKITTGLTLRLKGKGGRLRGNLMGNERH